VVVVSKHRRFRQRKYLAEVALFSIIEGSGWGKGVGHMNPKGGKGSPLRSQF